MTVQARHSRQERFAGRWALPLSATYVIGRDGQILFADTSVDYRRRTDPLEVLGVWSVGIAAE